MLTLKDISFTYPGASRPALEQINLEVNRGERVCIMGGNGSGKSTLVLLIAGLLKGYQGKLVNGSQDQAARLRSAILFQNPDSRMVATTVEREIAFSLECQGRPFPEMQPSVESAASRFGVAHLSRRQTYGLSGGEKQRVALASMFIIEPDLLILDEPDSFLDVSGRRILETELSGLRHTHPQLIELRITQYLSIAARYDRLWLLRDGQIAADGPPEKILNDHELCRAAGLDRNDPSLRVPLPRSERWTSSGGERIVSRLKVQDLSFGLDGVTLFEDLSFEVKSGRVVAIVGPSGSGKTTLAGLISGLAAPTSGAIKLLDDDDSILSDDESRGRVVQLVQFPERQFYRGTCREEVQAGPLNLQRRIGSREIEEMLASVGLTPQDFLERDPLTLSMGEKRRLALACLLIMNPDILILDEPTCGLDPAGVGWFEAMMAALKEQGVGLILISHDAALVRRLADTVISLTGNGMAEIQTAEKFFERKDWRDLLSEA